MSLEEQKRERMTNLAATKAHQANLLYLLETQEMLQTALLVKQKKMFADELRDFEASGPGVADELTAFAKRIGLASPADMTAEAVRLLGIVADGEAPEPLKIYSGNGRSAPADATPAGKTPGSKRKARVKAEEQGGAK